MTILACCCVFLQSPHGWRSSFAYPTSLDLRGSEQLHGCVQIVGIHELVDKFLELICGGEVKEPCAEVKIEDIHGGALAASHTCRHIEGEFCGC